MSFTKDYLLGPTMILLTHTQTKNKRSNNDAYHYFFHLSKEKVVSQNKNKKVIKKLLLRKNKTYETTVSLYP